MRNQCALTLRRQSRPWVHSKEISHIRDSVTNSVLVMGHQGPILMGRNLLGKLKLDRLDISGSCSYI